MNYLGFFKIFNHKSCIVFSIGDKGVILTTFKSGVLINRVYVKSHSEEEMRLINEVMNKAPSLPIYILLDNSSQTFDRETFPAVSGITIRNLLKKKLENNFSNNDVKAYKLLPRTNNVKNEWESLLVSSSLSEELETWIGIILSYSNPLKGVCTLPMEVNSLHAALNRFYLPDTATTQSAEHNRWQILTCHTKISGFRQIVYKNNEIVFTRVISTIEADSVDFLAGNLVQEVENCRDLLQKAGYKKEDNLDVLFITSAEVKLKLKNATLKANNAILLTPFEVAEKLDFTQAALAQDKYADVIIAANFIKSTPSMYLSNHFFKTLYFYNVFKKIGNVFLFIILPALAFFWSTTIYEIFHVRGDLQILDKEKIVTIEEFNKYKAVLNETEEPSKVMEVIRIYKKLVGNYQTPFNILEKMQATMHKTMAIQSIDWKYASPLNNNASNSNSIIATFKIYINKEEGLYTHYTLFEEIDKFIADLSSTFVEYNVDYNRMNQKTNDNAMMIPLQVTISGPKSDQPIEGKGEN
jgi:hypothetical protein